MLPFYQNDLENGVSEEEIRTDLAYFFMQFTSINNYFNQPVYLGGCKENEEAIQGFTNALQKGMDYVNSHTPEEIASVIKEQFPETDLETITTIVARYHEQNTWNTDLIFSEDSFMLLQNILMEAGELDDYVPYQDLVDTKFASEVAK